MNETKLNAIHRAVDTYKELILASERYLWTVPETGYREVKTSAYVAEQFEKLGYTLTYAEGITGFITRIETGREGPEVLILGELDSIICPAHPDADPVTGAVHSCGHHAQCATLIGIAAALTDPAVLEGLSGNIRLCAVPAEELLEIEYRSELMKAGKIKYFGGKSEFLCRGLFDGVDLAFMVHASGSYAVQNGSVGCLAKNVIYKGRASHAGGSPWGGINALYAANCGINAANAVRETFKEADLIRFHPIITHGGDMVNAIPEEVRLESYVRGSSFEAMAENNKKLNRALIGGALSLGANIEIIDAPGYAPLHNDPEMIEVAAEAAAMVLPEGMTFKKTGAFSTGSTDMGDLSCIMPVVHPYAGGVAGKGHGNDYRVVDAELLCVTNAKWQLAMLDLLLSDGAKRAKEIVANYKPQFTKEGFLAYQDSLNSSGNRIVYGEDGTATVTLDPIVEGGNGGNLN
ncbi:MAG: amidohydrolase [Ruminococcaceae bacterium]|nr:amidohydrolase [Oscillospiraceae bacterium]